GRARSSGTRSASAPRATSSCPVIASASTSPAARSRTWNRIRIPAPHSARTGLRTPCPRCRPSSTPPRGPRTWCCPSSRAAAQGRAAHSPANRPLGRDRKGNSPANGPLRRDGGAHRRRQPAEAKPGEPMAHEPSRSTTIERRPQAGSRPREERTVRIDAFAHVLPPRYRERVLELLRARGDRVASDYERMLGSDPTLVDLEERFRLMDESGPDYRQVLVMGHTSAEHEAPDVAAELARVGNQELAQLVAAHPDRCIGWVAQTALQAGERGLAAVRQAVAGQGAVGAQVFTSMQGRS